ncbi:hypothetical protein ACFE04_026511 [Oxalis oulophora]
MSSFFSLSSPSLQFYRRAAPPLTLPNSNAIKTHTPRLKREFVLLQLRCSSTQKDDVETETEIETTSFLDSPSVSSSNSTYKWSASAALGIIGFLETSYLTYLKLSNSDAFCPITGGSCGDVLNSQYAVVFGVPLPLIGMAAYGLVTAFSLLQLSEKKLPFGITETYPRFILLGTTTSMAASSAYFLYILSTRFSGTLCPYCLVSAFLSFSLFFITLKDVGFQEVQKAAGLQLCIASLVVVALSTSYGNSQSIPSSLAESDLPYFTVEITTPSSPFAFSLAKYLHSIGAKMYGAFWCSHCLEQKEMFGSEAAKYLDYVECFPEGYRKGIQIAKACSDAKIDGFPTWIINDQVISGEQELSDLAEVSGFKFNE